jgi:hypothetical protein
MIETEWLACTDPRNMIDFLSRKISGWKGRALHWLGFPARFASDRKSRLFACACCRRIWDFLPEEGRRAVEVAESYADGASGMAELERACDAVAAQREFPGLSKSRKVTRHYSVEAAALAAKPRRMRNWEVLWAAHNAAEAHVWAKAVLAVRRRKAFVKQGIVEESKVQCAILRDIFGNPFRPLPPRPEAIAPLAERIYAGEWDKMPLLGEWLQEHGYWSEGEHCLDPNLHHVKGCWVVDWVTGRE